MFLFFFSLLSSVHCEEEVENKPPFKLPLSPEEHMQKMNQMKEKIENYRSQKRKLIEELEEVRDKIHKAKQDGADFAELEKEQKEVRQKIIDLDSEFRQTRSKIFRDDLSYDKQIHNRVDPQVVASKEEKSF
ncbi:hypothetical protein TVAG_414450 [Trichomonas vaginalis G3]|uniref:Uncharacterized protein n=1 Tax=Trichomonas vaginalis (strain ATCC PRA-98 / G3) TaxID=412133 RepID=A2FDR4_TRIV3|nr:hypothetical protein TVAGG3_0563170 [Trichomonas vaginalis G3]EAX96964.1 hypothetical protein TVAG_414450 [Trichomonas vaginalis G3]KAI5521362.1 hypothetical protein TVAGG3_0563170 [Trichomonas vaginalis G3]|eukprot:XP_001309894.1 hypothetical protein [Trichomonas vaginalis G3]